MATKKQRKIEHPDTEPSPPTLPEETRPTDAIEALKTGLIPDAGEAVREPLLSQEQPVIEAAPKPGALPKKLPVAKRNPLYRVTNKRIRLWFSGSMHTYTEGTLIDADSYSQREIDLMREQGVELEEVPRE